MDRVSCASRQPLAFIELHLQTSFASSCYESIDDSNHRDQADDHSSDDPDDLGILNAALQPVIGGIAGTIENRHRRAGGLLLRVIVRGLFGVRGLRSFARESLALDR